MPLSSSRMDGGESRALRGAIPRAGLKRREEKACLPTTHASSQTPRLHWTTAAGATREISRTTNAMFSRDCAEYIKALGSFDYACANKHMMRLSKVRGRFFFRKKKRERYPTGTNACPPLNFRRTLPPASFARGSHKQKAYIPQCSF